MNSIREIFQSQPLWPAEAYKLVRKKQDSFKWEFVAAQIE